mmetsp:Transcript_38785/g.102288  ORF Transcript_38785/g.102288 Transcript_38785/m.102288 type:complete len:321 (+) Transcript_38785:591-1553(+)
MPIRRRSLRMCSVWRLAITSPLYMHLRAYVFPVAVVSTSLTRPKPPTPSTASVRSSSKGISTASVPWSFSGKAMKESASSRSAARSMATVSTLPTATRFEGAGVCSRSVSAPNVLPTPSVSDADPRSVASPSRTATEPATMTCMPCPISDPFATRSSASVKPSLPIDRTATSFSCGERDTNHSTLRMAFTAELFTMSSGTSPSLRADSRCSLYTSTLPRATPPTRRLGTAAPSLRPVRDCVPKKSPTFRHLPSPTRAELSPFWGSMTSTLPDLTSTRQSASSPAFHSVSPSVYVASVSRSERDERSSSDSAERISTERRN